MSNRINEIRALVKATPQQAPATVGGVIRPPASSLRNYIAPVQLPRLSQDVTSWRAGIFEAERAYYPERVRMQQMYIDTILNGHVYSLMERRKDLTLLRDFTICDKTGKEEFEDLTAMFRESEWFSLFMGYALDAKFFGYSLIELGDVVADEFPDLTIIKRWHVSPDRKIVQPFIYSPHGPSFVDPEFIDNYVWVPTPTDNGASSCGYGLFYQIGLYEIILRNTLGFNSDFVELYAMPYRLGKTTKTSDAERARLAEALQSLGSAGWAILDEQDSIEFLETNLGGTGWKGYENLEQRCEKKVSKIVLGHADAMDSTPGKIGGSQGEELSPVAVALTDKQTKDGRFIEAITTRQLIPRMRRMGFSIPEGARIRFKNDQEVEEFRRREDQSNKITAEIALNMKNAGLQMDAAYFQERTGIPTEKIVVPPLIPPGGGFQSDKNSDKPEDKKPVNNRIKAKLEKLYK